MVGDGKTKIVQNYSVIYTWLRAKMSEQPSEQLKQFGRTYQIGKKQLRQKIFRLFRRTRKGNPQLLAKEGPYSAQIIIHDANVFTLER